VFQGEYDMRFMTVFALSMTALLVPAFAVSDPVQGSSGANTQTPPASTAMQPQAPSQAASQPAQTAAAPATPTQPAAAATGVDLDQIVCKEAPAKTGSRLGGGRECHSQREWNRIEKEAQDITRRQQQMGYMGGGH